MNRVLRSKIAKFQFALLFLFVSSVYSVNRTWTGAVNLDFNNVGNWTGGGSLSAVDNFTITLTVNANTTISLSSSITVGDLVFNMNSGSGQRTGKLMVGANTLTVNGLGQFNAVRFSSPTSYDVLKLDIATGGNVIFNGQCNFHTTGSGDTYLTTNDLTGSSTSPGTVTFNGGLYVGTWGRTVGLYEPHMVFNGTASQVAVIKCNGGAYMFKSQNLTFGSTNASTVTVRGRGAVYFDSYDGNMNIGANTSVIVPDCTLVGYMTELGRFNTGAGTMTVGANAVISMGCPNQQPMSGFGTYNHAASSTVTYNSAGWQQMLPITYGNVICDGTGNPGWKYSMGAQTMQGNFTVQNSAVYGPLAAGGLTINGNTLIQSSAVFNATNNNGYSNITHTLKGNFTNNSSFTSGSPTGINTLLFNSSTVGQSIGGTSQTTFYNLTTDNTSGSGVTMNLSENVANIWTLTNGPVNLNSYTLTVTNTATGAIVRTNGYAVSETNAAINPSVIQWNMTAANTGAHIYPFGVAGTYIPFTFNKTSTANAVNIKVSTRATGTTNTPWAGVSSVAAVGNMFSTVIGADGSLESVIDRWWDINASAAVTANLTFVYRGSENTTTYGPTGTFGAQHWNGTSWDAPVGSGTGVTAGTGTVTVTGASTFSPWVISNIAAPLPIELLDFSAVLNGKKVDIKWTTSTETNNAYFTIEKSKDGRNFTKVAMVLGAGNSLVPRKYYDCDYEPFAGISYYRLKQTDLNGEFKYFNMVAVEVLVNPAIEVYPNPVASNSTLTMHLSGYEDKPVLVVLRDMNGKELLSKTVIGKDGDQLIALDVKDIPPGSYLVVANSNNKIYSKSIIIK